MRYALVNLLNSLHDLGGPFDLKNMFELIPNRDGDRMAPAWTTPEEYRFTNLPEVPFIVMSHMSWEPRFSGRPVVFLAREPGDVIVSHFHHRTRHDGRLNGMTLAQFAGDPDWGIADLVAYLSSWQPHLDDPDVTVMTYERLKAEPLGAFGHLVAGLGIEAGPKELQAALDAASIERMREVEARSGEWQPHSYDLNDPNARRVRKALVGAWREEMDDDTIALLLAEIEASPKARDLLERLDLMPGPAPV
jgi:hypothetical protein